MEISESFALPLLTVSILRSSKIAILIQLCRWFGEQGIIVGPESMNFLPSKKMLERASNLNGAIGHNASHSNGEQFVCYECGTRLMHVKV